MRNLIIEYGQMIITVTVLVLVSVLLLSSGSGWLHAIGAVVNNTPSNKLDIMTSREKPTLNISLADNSFSANGPICISKNGYAIDTDYYTLQASSGVDKEMIENGMLEYKDLTKFITVTCNDPSYYYDEFTQTGWLNVPGSYKLTFTITEVSDEDSDDVYYASTTKTIALDISYE